MTTPVYEVGIYTYKSPLALNGSDVIGVHDITTTETSIGVNTIGDYDGYYISTSTPTFKDTFVPKSVVGPTLSNAFAANVLGGQVSQEITNTFSVANSQLIIPGFKQYAPIIPGATLTVNQTYTPVATNVSGTLTVPYNKQLSIIASSTYLQSKLYKCVPNAILNVFYYAEAYVKWKKGRLEGNGCGTNAATTVGENDYSDFNVGQNGQYPITQVFAPPTNFHYPDVTSFAFPNSSSQDLFYGLNAEGTAYISPYYVGKVDGALRGYGKLPASVINENGYQLNSMTFYMNQSDGDFFSTNNATNTALKRGSLYLNGTIGAGITLVSNAQARLNVSGQYNSNAFNQSNFLETCCSCCSCAPGVVRTYADSRTVSANGFVNKQFTLVKVKLAVQFSNGSIIEPVATESPGIIGDDSIFSLSNYTYANTPTKFLVPTQNVVSNMLMNVASTINSDSQSVQLTSFETNTSGVQATNLYTNTKTTLISQSSLDTYYNSGSTGDSISASESDVIGNVYLDLVNTFLNVNYKYGSDTAQTVTRTNLTGGYQLDILATSANLTITNSTSNFQTFLNQIIASPNFNYTNRAFTISAGSNSLSSVFSGGSSSYDFSSAVTSLGAITKPRNNWTLSITYTPSVPTSGQNFYLTSNNSNTFPSATSNTFTVNFNSAGTATTSSINRPTNDQSYSVYQRYNKTALVESWITPEYKVSFPGISNVPNDALTLFGLSVAGLPTNSVFNNLSLTFNVSFLGDPSNFSTYTFSNNSAATLVQGTVQERQYPANALTRGFDITSYIAALLGDGTATIDGNAIVSSFNASTNTIAGTQLPFDFYAPTVAGVTLTVDYKWGDKYNYTQVVEIFSISSSSIQVNQSNLSRPSTVITLYKKPDRQRLLQTVQAQLYFTTISSNKTGYTFTEVPFIVGRFDPGVEHGYSIYRLSDSGLISGVSDVTNLLNIDDNIDRTITKTFGSTPDSDSNVEVLNSVNGQVVYSFGEIVSASVGFAATGTTMVNQFLQFDNTKLTDLTTSSLYLFVTPTVNYSLMGPSLAAETNPYWMPKYINYNPGVNGRSGIPTFGATLHSYQNYIVTNRSDQLSNIVNQVDYNTTEPFSRFDVNTISADQVSGFLQKDFRYIYYNITSDIDPNSSLYALPFNFQINSDKSYNIAFGNNYITLQYFNINSAWYTSEYNMTSADYPLLNNEPLYNEFKWFTPVNDSTGTEITEITGFKLKDNKGNVISTFTNSAGYYDDFFVKSTFLPNLIYSDYNSLLYISPIFSSPRDIPDFVLPRFFVPPSLVISNPELFLTINSVSDDLDTLFATTFGITLPNSGGSIQFDNENLPTYTPPTPAFTIIIPGVPETPFDIEVVNGTARFVVPFLMPSTTYNNVSVRYYPYLTNSDPRLQPLSDIAQFDGINFTTPDTHAFTTTSTYAFDTDNTRICRVTLVNPQLKMLVAPFSTRDIAECLLVFDTQNSNILISSNGVSTYAGKVTIPATQATITFELKELARGLVIKPIVYLKKIINTVEYTSNIQVLSTMTVPTRPDIKIDWSGNLVHSKQVNATNFDVYREFLIGDYSLPFNDRSDGNLQLLRSNTVLNYSDMTPQYLTGANAYSCGTASITNSTPTLSLDLNNVPGGTYSTFNLCFVPHHYVQTAMTQIVVTDPTGKRKDIDLRVTSPVGILLSSKLLSETGFTVENFTGTLPNPRVSFYGPLISSSYNTTLPFDRVNFVVNDPAEFVRVIERLHTANSTLTLYDPTGIYAENTGSDAGVLSKISSSRIDVHKNVGYNYHLNTFTAPSGTTMGTFDLTYDVGETYTGLELNPFYYRVIAIPTTVPIFIAYINTGQMHLTDYVQQNVGFTIDACAFDGYSIEIAHPEDVDAGIAVYRDVFPSDRDASGVPTYRLDDFFTRVTQYTIYFESSNQIDAWNSSLTSDYWWTSPLARPTKSCPIQILNKATSAGPLREIVVTTNIQYMEGQPVTSPAVFYGSVEVGGFSYYAGTRNVDIATNSFPVLYNGGTLSIVDSTNKLYGSSEVPPQYSSSVSITLDKLVLTPSTIYNLFLVYTYSEAKIVGTARIAFQYEVPADQTNISQYTNTPLIHNLYTTISGTNIFGNLPLSDINVPSRLTLTSLDKFNFKHLWNEGTTYGQGDLVYLSDYTYYWLTDTARYVSGQSPKYGFGWRNFSATNSMIKGNYDSNTFYIKNNIVNSGATLYKVFDTVTTSQQLPAPGTLDRDTGLYAPYSENFIDHNIVFDDAFSVYPDLSYLFTGLVPNSNYNVSYSLKVGDTFTSLFSLGNYRTLPDILDCRGITFDSTAITLTNMSYENSNDYFDDGFVTKVTDTTVQYEFAGSTAVMFPSDTIDQSVYYSPQVVRDVDIEDYTQAYNLNQNAGTLDCLINGPTLTHNSAIFEVVNFKPTGLTVNTNDHIGIFKGTTFWGEIQLTNARVVPGDYARFMLPIQGLLSVTSYPDFNFQYRVNNTHYYSGIPVQLPPFTTTPILFVRLSVAPGAVGIIVKILRIEYCSRLLTGLFPVEDPLNSISVVLENLYSVTNTSRPFMTPISSTTTSKNIKMDLSPLSVNPNNYLLDFIKFDYTFVDELGIVKTLRLSGAVPPFNPPLSVQVVMQI